MEKQILFQLKSRVFALPITKVERIINLNLLSDEQTHEKPFMGTTKYNKKVMPVINMAVCLINGELETEDESQVMVVHWKGNKIGLAVDEVTAVKVFAEERVEKNINNETQKNCFIPNFIQTEEGKVSLIQIESFFNTQTSDTISTLLNENVQ